MRWILLVCCLLLPGVAPALDTTRLGQLPILEDGRVKPLSTYAENNLRQLYGRAHLPDSTATDWLAELIFEPYRAYRQPVFNISSPDVVDLLGLTWTTGHRYTFMQVSTAMRDRMDLVNTLFRQNLASLTASQSQLLELYQHMTWFFDASRSLTLVLPYFEISDAAVAKKLDLPLNQPFTYLDLMQHKAAFMDAINSINPASASPDSVTKNMLALGATLRQIDGDTQSRAFKIVPPQWSGTDGVWMAPWEVFVVGAGSPQTAAYLDTWATLAKAWQNKDAAGWDAALAQAWNAIQPQLAEGKAPRLTWEVLYNKVQLFKLSFALYLLAFVALLASGLLFRKRMKQLGVLLLAAGWVSHIVGLILRIYIMARPPVATLYESILFVGAISVALALFLEWKRKDGTGLFMGSVLGMVLQLIGLNYAAQGDSMGMLVAVLNTNFWLATHVVVITMGYGASLVAGVLGHLYLMQRWLAPQPERLRSLMRQMLGVALIAVFFSLFGTILGGIWADQSWGRFWGWDPKENGALFIVLWLVWLLHGRVSGLVKPLWFGAGMVLTNVVVALAWFGVNLLGVGLHSYGFTENIATNLLTFCGLELLFALLLTVIIYNKEHRHA